MDLANKFIFFVYSERKWNKKKENKTSYFKNMIENSF